MTSCSVQVAQRMDVKLKFVAVMVIEVLAAIVPVVTLITEASNPRVVQVVLKMLVPLTV